jgi:hypothetical protein
MNMPTMKLTNPSIRIFLAMSLWRSFKQIYPTNPPTKEKSNGARYHAMEGSDTMICCVAGASVTGAAATWGTTILSTRAPQYGQATKLAEILLPQYGHTDVDAWMGGEVGRGRTTVLVLVLLAINITPSMKTRVIDIAATLPLKAASPDSPAPIGAIIRTSPTMIPTTFFAFKYISV